MARKAQGNPRVGAILPYPLGEWTLPLGGGFLTPQGVRAFPPTRKGVEDLRAQPFPYLFLM
jgi:hypothetical protein